MKITYAGAMNDSFVLRRSQSDPLDAWFATDAAAQELSASLSKEGVVVTSTGPVAAAPEWVPKLGERVQVKDEDQTEWINGRFVEYKEGLPFPWHVKRDDSLGLFVYEECRPIQLPSAKPAATVGEWIEWKGGKCPVEAKVEVEYRCQNGGKYTRIAGNLRWDWKVVPGDIIAYRLVSPS